MNRTSSTRVCFALFCAASVAVLIMFSRTAWVIYDHDGFYWPPREVTIRSVTTFASLHAVIGLPIAWFFSLLIGFPIWRFAEKRGPIAFWRGARWGAVTGAMISGLFTAFGFLYGLQDYFDEKTYGSFATGEGLLKENGIWTLLGWWYQGVQLIYYSTIGAIAGLVAVFVGRKSIEGLRLR